MKKVSIGTYKDKRELEKVIEEYVNNSSIKIEQLFFSATSESNRFTKYSVMIVYTNVSQEQAG